MLVIRHVEAQGRNNDEAKDCVDPVRSSFLRSNDLRHSSNNLFRIREKIIINQYYENMPRYFHKIGMVRHLLLYLRGVRHQK